MSKSLFTEEASWILIVYSDTFGKRFSNVTIDWTKLKTNKMCYSCLFNSEVELREMSLPKMYEKMFFKLEDCTDEDQKRIIEKMHDITCDMNNEEMQSVFNEEKYILIREMMNIKKLSLDNAILLMKRIGHCKALRMYWDGSFDCTGLCSDLESMIISIEKNVKEEIGCEESSKKRNEKLLTDLCECVLMLNDDCFFNELFSFSVRCLLKEALNIEEDKETQKDVEMALLAMSNIGEYKEIDKELFLNEISEIIRYHQEHRNLTQLAYQSAWQFLIRRFRLEKGLRKIIANELSFGREAVRELDELIKCVDWKKTEKELKKTKEVWIIMRYLKIAQLYFGKCRACSEEDQLNEFIERVIKLKELAKDSFKGMRNECIYFLKEGVIEKEEKIDSFAKSGAAGCVLAEILQPTLENYPISICFGIFRILSMTMRKRAHNTLRKAKWKRLKRETFEKLEEEGYEDTITSFYGEILIRCKYNRELLLNISDYFVNA
ncbi:uncharacterized protein MONOS_9671 [Monocercomonoides exilis]|uniref:uncharacterized protein n=1 Tax=Monocercomonoides exilis TaxID=2049356 RepID=UPI00355A177F|nr:hypothetical protein MONOS_9671 [Monocercomonoides exilis]|eukprot:MONOS_9671.1-p1 / transcript=MONOS_9671.1 / gene=MONOS_9671 / organism=Monocercomonoides_exilis_PA203 / gene_product=unspecified product / transcript_product=unspecified product / location=Mono_scaffold00407:49373-51192(-) / protein_length=492 / sequence_SO=supercontig / SO=protein_coding / is_pseudo=false